MGVGRPVAPDVHLRLKPARHVGVRYRIRTISLASDSTTSVRRP